MRAGRLVYARTQELLSLLAKTDLAWAMSGLNLVAGATAGAVAATAVTPFDVIKTRLQVSKGKATVLEVSRQLYAEGGIFSFFRGLGPRLARIPIYTAITLATFDAAK